MPILLYKYRKCNGATFEALENDCLYSAEPSTFNDIREVPLFIRSDLIWERAIQEAYDKFREEHKELPITKVKSENELRDIFGLTYGSPKGEDGVVNYIVSLIRAEYQKRIEQAQHMYRNMYNICCFSATSDNELMWAHYAEGHTGFCVAYAFKSLGIHDERVQCILPVLYQDKPCISVQDVSLLDGNMGMLAASLKDSQWAYENEWRQFFPHSKDPKPEKMPIPSALYLGARIEEANRKTLIETCEKKSIPVFQMELANYGKEIKPKRVV